MAIVVDISKGESVTAALRAARDRGDERLLADVFDRQRELAELELAIALTVYRARAIFIGGMCLPWGLLTKGQRQGYLMEAKSIIQEPQE